MTLSLWIPSTAEVSAQTADPAKEIIHRLRIVHGRTLKLDEHERDTSGKGIRLLPPDMQKDIPRSGEVLIHLDHRIRHVRKHHGETHELLTFQGQSTKTQQCRIYTRLTM